MAQGQSLESGGSASPARDGLSYLQRVLSALAELDRPATAAEIWVHIEKNQLYKRLRVYQEDKDLRTPHRKTPEDTAASALYDEAVKRGLAQTQDINPKRFVLTEAGKKFVATLVAPSPGPDPDLPQLLTTSFYAIHRSSGLRPTAWARAPVAGAGRLWWRQAPTRRRQKSIPLKFKKN